MLPTLPSPSFRPVLALQAVELQGGDAKPKSPTGFVFTPTQKTLLLVLVMGFLYLRLYMRKRKKDRICPHCGKRNPPQQSNCMNCSAPLMDLRPKA